MWFFARKERLSFLWVSDAVAWLVPIWLFLGRIGNYLNKELLGLPGYTWPLAVTKWWQTYFPTPLLEAFLEGVVLFLILFLIKRKVKKEKWKVWALSCWFLILYAVFRFFAEFFRTPDPQIGYIALGWVTMWQILSVVMLAFWFSVFLFLRKKIKKEKRRKS